MCYIVVYHKKVITEDLEKISQTQKIRIKKSIEEKISIHPDIFSKPLRKPLGTYRRARVGDYRIVFKVVRKTIKILAIIHRSKVYKEIQKRL